MKRKRLGFDSDLGTLPNQLSPERLLRYYRFLRYSKVRQNQQKAARKIIMAHARLAMALVGNLAVHYPTKTDLLVAEALWSVTHCVSMISAGALDSHNVPNVTGYILMSVTQHLKKAATSDRLMLGSGYAKGKHVNVVSIGDHEPLARPQDANDLFELILSITVDPIEATIVRMRSEGFNDRQIGHCLNMTHQDVGRRRSELWTKVKAIL